MLLRTGHVSDMGLGVHKEFSQTLLTVQVKLLYFVLILGPNGSSLKGNPTYLHKNIFYHLIEGYVGVADGTKFSVADGTNVQYSFSAIISNI